jgi:hypothetical protein
LVSIASFYIFYLIHTFDLLVQTAQLYLFLFLGSVAAGTVIGGPIGDRIGTRRVIWWSIFGVLPFTLALPYVGLVWTAVLSIIIGLILASAHPAIIVHAQSLVPGRVGMVAGLFFGLAFGIAGIGAALLGRLADATSIFRLSRLRLPSCHRPARSTPARDGEAKESAAREKCARRCGSVPPFDKMMTPDRPCSPALFKKRLGFDLPIFSTGKAERRDCSGVIVSMLEDNRRIVKCETPQMVRGNIPGEAPRLRLRSSALP